eukprot:6160133-Prymnesium_polylepis.1
MKLVLAPARWWKQGSNARCPWTASWAELVEDCYKAACHDEKLGQLHHSVQRRAQIGLVFLLSPPAERRRDPLAQRVLADRILST